MSLSKEPSAPASVEDAKCTHYITVCGICLSTYHVPKGLPCLHSFCLECIRQWTQASPGPTEVMDTKSLSCPNCGKEWALPDNGVEELPTNFFITERNPVETLPECSSCGKNDRDIVARCRQCGFVCKECMLPHKSMRALREHGVIMLDKLRIGKIAANQLGNLAIAKRHGNGVFKLEKTIKLKSFDSSYNAWCCAVLPETDYHQVAVPTHSSCSSKVHVFGIDGENKLTIDTQVGLHPGRTSRPFNVCVNSDGVMYITDCDPWVKVHSAQGQFMHLFQLADVNGIPCKTGNAHGIAIDVNQQIIVGDISNKTISIYTKDEAFIKSFGVDIDPYYLAATFHGDNSESLLVCDVIKDTLLQVDYSGKVLRNISVPITDMAWMPRGVCCSKDGEIFVANAASDKAAVIRFSNSWKYTGCVVTNLSSPSGIAISKDEEILALIDCHSELKIFRRS